MEGRLKRCRVGFVSRDSGICIRLREFDKIARAREQASGALVCVQAPQLGQ